MGETAYKHLKTHNNTALVNKIGLMGNIGGEALTNCNYMIGASTGAASESKRGNKGGGGGAGRFCR